MNSAGLQSQFDIVAKLELRHHVMQKVPKTLSSFFFLTLCKIYVLLFALDCFSCI